MGTLTALLLIVALFVILGAGVWIGIENYQDVKVGDQLEVIEFIEVARKLKDSDRLESKDAKAANEPKKEAGE